MLTAILSFLGIKGINAIVEGIFSQLTGVLDAWVKKEISDAQLKEKIQEALLSSFAQVDMHFADAINAGFNSFLDNAAKSKLLQAVWAATAVSQLFVLLWYQFVVPGLVTLHWIDKYASAGATVDWAYALVMFCLGGGAAVFRFGPASSLKDQLKSLIGK